MAGEHVAVRFGPWRRWAIWGLQIAMKQIAKDLHVQMSSSSYIVSCYREYETENKTKGTIFVKDKKETRRKLDRKKKNKIHK